jgi:hypothetical protein
MSVTSEEYFEICDHALGKFMEHARQPCPEDIFVQERWIMCGACVIVPLTTSTVLMILPPRSHTVFTESMRQMYKVADTVTPEDEQAFALYCFAFAQVF